MNDEALDEGTDAAVRELADHLGVTLRGAIRDAGSDALQRVREDMESHLARVEAAREQIGSVLDTIGDQLRARALTALGEGVRNEVLPLLEQEGRKISASAAQAVSTALAALAARLSETHRSIVDGHGRLEASTTSSLAVVAESVATAERELRKALTAMTATVTAHGNDHAAATKASLREIGAAVAEGTGQILARSDATASSVAKEVKESGKSVRADLTTARTSLAETIEKVETSVTRRLAEVSKHVSATQDQLSKQAGVAAHALAGQTATMLTRLSAHDVAMRRLLYGEVAIAALTIAAVIVAHVIR